MPWRKDNRSPSQVTRDSGGGVAEISGETYFSHSVTPFDQSVLGLARPTTARRRDDLAITLHRPHPEDAHTATNQRTRNAEERRREESRIIANDEPPPF
jgi:hypothetical protein